jgi:hypothetical protein
MPVQFDEYRNESSGLDLDDSETRAVLSFLDADPNTGFTATEISDGAGIDREGDERTIRTGRSGSLAGKRSRRS